MSERLKETVHRAGYALTDVLLRDEDLENARREAGRIAAEAAGRGGVRSVLRRSSYFKALASQVLNVLAREVLGAGATAVKGTLFDKTADANWKVPWHQDLTISVRERRHVPGFGPWSVKDGVIHVQPAIQVLEAIVAVRLHLDDAASDNGALKVLPGTHLVGRIDDAEREALQAACPAVVCAARAGQALIMSPLLLHASSSSDAPSHRRVLHVEYASQPLPGGLEWAV